MPLTSDTETRQTITLVVTVRVPNRADGDLTTTVERRLSRVDGILAVTVGDLQGLQPGLSATEVTVRVTVEATKSQPPGFVEETLARETGVELTSS